MHFIDAVDDDVEFEYDENGNMTADLNNDIKSISYNALNLPLKILFNNKSYIVYSYTATGEKIRVDYYRLRTPPSPPSDLTPPQGTLSFTDSSSAASEILKVHGPTTPTTAMVHTYTEYCGNHILENGKLKQSLFDGGYITYSDGEPEFHFYVRDHQGNNRLVMSEDGVVEQVNDYTPFGVQMKNSFTATSSQRYKYNSKELDRMFGLDLYDYGARFYDARIARWQTIDPLCEKYYSISPYVYCANNPINLIDYDGLYPKEIVSFYRTSTLSPDYYKLTKPAAHLLSLVSSVSESYIQQTVIWKRGPGHYLPWYSSNKKGGAITLGSQPNKTFISMTPNYFEDDNAKYNGYGFGQDIDAWLNVLSHEVVHIKHIEDAGNIIRYSVSFIADYMIYADHDKVPREIEADKSRKNYTDFIKFVNQNIGFNELINLFKSKIDDDAIIETINNWWLQFKEYIKNNK
jgi:RHS repeat-associated protein